MAITIDDDHEIYRDGERIMIPRDGNHSPSALLSGFDTDENLTFGRFTTDGRLKVDASVTIDHVDIGDVNTLLKVDGVNQYLGGVLNPDTTTYAGYVQDQRMSFTGGSLNVNPGMGLTPVHTTITRDPSTQLVSQIDEDDGTNVKTTMVVRDADNNVLELVESIA